jgi:hypothetical protein
VSDEAVPTDDLLEQARARLRELEEQDTGDELGERVELGPGGYFRGRFRGEATMVNKEGERIPVVALWDVDGRHRFHYRNAGLVAELDASRPDVGDEIVIVRGEDVEFEAQGEQRRMHRYAVRVKPSSEPLPGAAAAQDEDDEFPF